MWKSGLLLISLLSSVYAADKMTAPQLIQLAKSHNAGLRDAITRSFDAKYLKNGTAWAGRGSDFFFVTEAASRPELIIDDAPGPRMQALKGTNFWYAVARIKQLGKLHAFHYKLDGHDFGGSLDVPAFGPLSYLEPGVPSGALSEKITHTSKLYDGMKSDYWIYVPAQYDPNISAALMVFQDGKDYRTQREPSDPERHR